MIRTLGVCLVVLCALAFLASAIQFDLHAVPAQDADNSKRCLSQFVPDDTKVLTTVNVGDGYNQRVDLEIFDNSNPPNVYTNRKGISDEIRIAFLTKSKGHISVCFKNVLSEGFHMTPETFRTIDLDFNTGVQASVLEAKKEKLEPLEMRMQMIEGMMDEIIESMEYYRVREARMRSTNESTNERVKWFSITSLMTLILLGVWQVLYLRQFFRRKRLID